jgi:peptide deformylase
MTDPMAEKPTTSPPRSAPDASSAGDFADLKIINWPDPRLKKMSEPVEVFDDALGRLAVRMLELMRGSKGVGLAAPQVGKNIRLFVMNPTGQPGDDRVYVNPELSDLEGDDEAEEGCLSLPEIHVQVVRAKKATLRARGVNGQAIEEAATGFVARVWQHEFDHLNGVLLTDRMGFVDKMANRRTLKELEEKYAEEQRKKKK